MSKWGGEKRERKGVAEVERSGEGEGRGRWVEWREVRNVLGSPVTLV